MNSCFALDSILLSMLWKLFFKTTSNVKMYTVAGMARSSLRELMYTKIGGRVHPQMCWLTCLKGHSKAGNVNLKVVIFWYAFSWLSPWTRQFIKWFFLLWPFCNFHIYCGEMTDIVWTWRKPSCWCFSGCCLCESFEALCPHKKDWWVSRVWVRVLISPLEFGL